MQDLSSASAFLTASLSQGAPDPASPGAAFNSFRGFPAFVPRSCTQSALQYACQAWSRELTREFMMKVIGWNGDEWEIVWGIISSDPTEVVKKKKNV